MRWLDWLLGNDRFEARGARVLDEKPPERPPRGPQRPRGPLEGYDPVLYSQEALQRLEREMREVHLPEGPTLTEGMLHSVEELNEAFRAAQKAAITSGVAMVDLADNLRLVKPFKEDD